MTAMPAAMARSIRWWTGWSVFALPTICALNGGVYGGSTDMALSCDFRIGVEGITMFMPAARLGLHYYAGGMRRYVARLGLGAAKKLFLTGGQAGHGRDAARSDIWTRRCRANG